MKPQLFSSISLAILLGCLPGSAQQPSGGLPEPPPQAPSSSNGGYYPQGAPPSSQVAPSTLTIPADTLLTVRTTELVSSDQNKPGDAFTTILDQPLVVQGWVVARRGQVVQGRVVDARNAGRVKGVSELAVELNELILVDGQQLPIRTQLVESSAGTSHDRDVAGVGATTGIGAIIGAAAGGGKGAAIGAAAGAAAGIAGVLTTRGRPTEIYPETRLAFRIEDPVTINTSQSRQAFLPVTPQDYENNNAGTLRNPPRYRATESYPPPPPYYYPYYYPPYPGYYFGYYGYGPGIFVGPRMYLGRGFHRRW